MSSSHHPASQPSTGNPIIIQCRGASASILPQRGALLSSLKLCLRGASGGNDAQELLHTADDFQTEESGWPGGGCPVMFPFAGRVFHQGVPFQYALHGRVLTMPLHGFAYALPWHTVQQDSRSVTLELRGSDKTYEFYPYDFRLQISYELLSAQRLCIRLEAENLGARAEVQDPMPVAFGLHPYFKLDTQAYDLYSQAQERLAVTPAGAAGKSSTYPGEDEIPNGRGGLPLERPLLRNLILGQHQQPEASLVHRQEGQMINLAWSPGEVFRYVVLWSPAGAPFYCLEPWMGLPDAVSTGAGLRLLSQGERVHGDVVISLSE